MTLFLMNALPPGLYIVATPIGNLSDLSPRAADVPARAEREAMVRLSASRVAAEVPAKLGVPRRQAYERALKLK